MSVTPPPPLNYCQQHYIWVHYKQIIIKNNSIVIYDSRLYEESYLNLEI
jgi:hypothetical protein